MQIGRPCGLRAGPLSAGQKGVGVARPLGRAGQQRASTARADDGAVSIRQLGAYQVAPRPLAGRAGRLAGRTPRALQVAAPVSARGTKPGSKKAKGPVLLDENRFEDVGLAVRAEQHGEEEYTVHLRLDAPRGMVLHWAVDDWKPPPQPAWPRGTNRVDDKACQTAFGGDGAIDITFPAEVCPNRIVFVLKQTQDGETWFNNGGANYAVQLKPPPLEDFVEKVLAAEGTNTHWSLPQRLMLATDVLDAADAAGPAGMSFIYAWLRLSSTRVLDWYRGANFQPKDVAHMQKHAGERMADKARRAGHPLSRLLARGALAGLPRGGGNGDEIRMGILHIMRGNGIKEGHRPGHDEPFLEQWHQKLHTNTTPDDVTICEAYLAFLHSGNHDDYWRVLWENGRLKKEDLQSWPKPVSALPHHLPHLIGPFKHYLWILKTTHSGADLDMAMEMAKGHMDEETRWMLYDVLAHRNEWWVPGKIVEGRERLARYWKEAGSSRDLLLLDIALESWFRTCLERTDFGAMPADDQIELVALVLRGALITHESEDLEQCAALWGRLRATSSSALPGARWGGEWSLAALAAAERLQLSVAAHMDGIYGMVQPHAEAFGKACKLDPAYIANFGEEVVRGQPLFIASLLLQKLEPALRTAAGGAPWQIVGQPATPSVCGEVAAVFALSEVQGAAFDRPTILLAATLTGVEDIPAGVVAVLTRSSTDVLSHLAIRARSQQVLLATCFDDDAWAEWQERVGSTAAAVVDTAAGAVLPADAPAASAQAYGSGGAAGSSGLPRITLPPPERTSAWALPEGSFRSGLVGAKALNLKTLRDRLSGADVGVPASVALPYGTFERVLAGGPNAGVAAEVGRLTAAAGVLAAAGTLPCAELEQLRKVVSEGLVAPRELVAELAAAAAAQGLIASPEHWTDSYAAAPAEEDDEEEEEPSPTSWPAVWSAVCRVWASKWTDRAWLSRRALSIPEDSLFMSVLLQQVVPVTYAFVLHTSNPVTHTPGELLGEVVVGMGETLVGNYPGRALGFTAGADGGEPKLLSLPSKRLALHAPPRPTLIARSDANAEDLEQYAAAGLYDSVTLQPLVVRPVDYAAEPLLGDPAFRGALLGGLTGLGRTVQAAFGGRDQDVEGGWLDGRFYVVQARPQVELLSR